MALTVMRTFLRVRFNGITPANYGAAATALAAKLANITLPSGEFSAKSDDLKFDGDAVAEAEIVVTGIASKADARTIEDGGETKFDGVDHGGGITSDVLRVYSDRRRQENSP